MPKVLVHDLWLEREEPAAPPPRVRVHEVSLVRTPPEAPPPRVRVHGFALTRGFTAPHQDGGLFRRVDGTWVPIEILYRSNGAWV